MRAKAEEDLGRIREAAHQQEGTARQEEKRVGEFQSELDKLGTMLREIERHNEQMRAEIAVTRRATYAAEEAAQRIEKEKKGQDSLIDRLQETLKQHNQQIALFKAQIMAQREETKQALDTLAEADREMEAVYFEKKQLASQWKSTLTAVAKRDEALQAVEEAIRHQGEEELALLTELEGFRREIRQEQGKNEQLTAILKKVECESLGTEGISCPVLISSLLCTGAIMHESLSSYSSTPSRPSLPPSQPSATFWPAPSSSSLRSRTASRTST